MLEPTVFPVIKRDADSTPATASRPPPFPTSGTSSRGSPDIVLGEGTGTRDDDADGFRFRLSFRPGRL